MPRTVDKKREGTNLLFSRRSEASYERQVLKKKMTVQLCAGKKGIEGMRNEGPSLGKGQIC